MNDASYKDWGWQSAAFGSAHGHLLPSLLAMLGRPRGPVLDVGCGNGAIARALIAQGYDVYGVDASESGVAIANAQVPDHFFVLDVTSGALPAALAGRRFDVVISTEVIEHLYDPRSFIDFARRHLAGDGEFILSTPYHGYLKNLVMALTGKLDDHFNVLWDGGHIKFFSRKTLERMLREQGFEVTGFAGSGRLPWLWKSMLVKARVA